ncbi:hypothetical protein ACGVWS_01705 [Enterobacteriaceae bacterium LUAb1]
MSKDNALFYQVKENITFESLWSQAMDTITSLSGNNWTDTGEHDPGITLLQAITWNCSDLSYRTSLSINDLLTKQGQPALFPAAFGPHRVLTCNTITAEDYRRALRDLHSRDTALKTDKHDFLFRDVCLIREPEQQRFHWWYNTEKREYSFIEPQDDSKPKDDETEATKKQLKLRGNYWLYVAPTLFTRLLSDKEHAVVVDHLNDFIVNHRNLGENISRIIWLEPAAFHPKLTIELSADIDDINRVVAQIYQKIEALLLPAATHLTTAQMQEAGYSNEEIFSGPFLQHGWQLASEPKISEQGITLNLSQLFNQLLAIPGVTNISHFSVAELSGKITPVKGDHWSWQVAGGHYPQLWGKCPLSLLASAESPLTLIAKGGISSVADKDKIAAYLTESVLIQTEPVLLPAGNVRNLGHYTPTGNHLPGCYQLQEPEEVITDAIRELHQFLLPVDQWLADGGAELAALPQLLAFTDREESNIIRATRWPYHAESVNQQVHKEYASQLADLQQQDVAIFVDEQTKHMINPANFYRELDFINYLLGYFGTCRAARPLTLSEEDFLITQRSYLAQQPSLGYDRINIRVDQVSALQKRLAARIGLNQECFAAEADLGHLPFYLIEHRQLLPQKPDDHYNDAQALEDFQVTEPSAGRGSEDEQWVILTAAGTADRLFRGQLVELIAEEKDSQLHVGPLLIIAVSADSFTLSTKHSQQLARDLPRLQTAWANQKLTWQNSNVWLQDMDYRLNYAQQQPGNENQRWLASNDQSPYPAMIMEQNEIIIRKTSLAGQGGRTTAVTDANEWQIRATVVQLDVVNGMILIQKEEGSEAFPDREEAWRYQWYFSRADYATTDRFSFCISLVHRRSLLESSHIDPAGLIDWLQQAIMPEFPAHVSLINHWLSDTEFDNFALTYKRWQNSGNPLGDDAFAILEMLTLGRLPIRALGIGLMRIATEAQKNQVVGESGEEWHSKIILQEELGYVPPNDSVFI